MELNKEQISFIDNYLKEKGVKYWDVRLEMIDHIVNDMESRINFEGKNFDDAFKQSVESWEGQLSPKTSWITGIAYSKPKIIIQKATKILSKWLILYLFFVFLPLILNKNSFNGLNETISNYQFTITYVILILLILSNTLLISWFFKIDKTIIKSTYRFLFNTQALSAIILTPFILIEFFYHGRTLNLEPWIISFIGLELIATIFGYKMFKKHIESSDKFSLLVCN